MGSLALERNEEVGVDGEPAVRVDVDLHDPSADSLRIELRVNGRIEGVGYVNAPSVAAHFQHLRAAVERAALRMRYVRHDSAETHLAGELRFKRVADVVLKEVASAPA